MMKSDLSQALNEDHAVAPRDEIGAATLFGVGAGYASGHGLCGCARFVLASLIATATFFLPEL